MHLIKFYFLWLIAVFANVFRPFVFIIRWSIRLLFVVFLIWFIGGIGVWSYRYIQSLPTREQARRETNALLMQKAQLESLLKNHQNSRDVSLDLAIISLKLGDDTLGQYYWENLQKIDPNNTRVELLSSFFR
ncbi:MAG TPA: hypothetical protein VLH19_01415 [Patescibacteria group bacterium]|nr:hypothetical protein [Patescibacteria group bacterium]